MAWWIVAALSLTSAVIIATSDAEAAPADTNKIVATVGKHPITEQELEARIKPRLTRLRNQIYLLKKQAIERIAADYLIGQAAQRENLTTAEYLKRKLSTPPFEPTEKQVADFYNQHKGQIHQPLDKVKPAIISYLKQQDYQERRRKLLAELSKDQPVDLKIEAPRYDVVAGDNPALGLSAAPVAIIEFSDFQCPYCRKAEETLEGVRKKYGGSVRLVFRNYPLPIHPNAEKAAEAGECANEQAMFWPLHDAMFAEQSKLSVADLKASAAKLGIDTKKFNECLDKEKYAAKVQSDIAYGNSLGVKGTPTFFVNGRYLDGAAVSAVFDRMIDAELASGARKAASAR